MDVGVALVAALFWGHEGSHHKGGNHEGCPYRET
jgi:hypothetical protein